MESLTEKYRPTKLNDCILPLRIKSKLEKWKTRMSNHLIFYGNSGNGKTSTALALAQELSPNDYIIINASKENSVNYMNEYVAKTMRGISLYGDKRIIILDESDGLTYNAQTALRRPLEEYSHLSSVIFTFNFNKKIIAPIMSRCFSFCFNAGVDEIDETKIQLKKRLKRIIKLENIEIDNNDLKKIIEDNHLNFRNAVKELEWFI